MSKNTTIWVLQTVKEHPQKGLDLRLLSHFDERGKPRFTLSPLEAKWFRSRNHANTALDLRLKHMGFIARCYQVDSYGRWNLVTKPTWRQQHGITFGSPDKAKPLFINLCSGMSYADKEPCLS